MKLSTKILKHLQTNLDCLHEGGKIALTSEIMQIIKDHNEHIKNMPLREYLDELRQYLQSQGFFSLIDCGDEHGDLLYYRFLKDDEGFFIVYSKYKDLIHFIGKNN